MVIIGRYNDGIASGWGRDAGCVLGLEGRLGLSAFVGGGASGRGCVMSRGILRCAQDEGSFSLRIRVL